MSFEWDIKILKDRFNVFGMPIEFEDITIGQEIGFFSDKEVKRIKSVLFFPKNIYEYVEKSREIKEIMKTEFYKLDRGGPSSPATKTFERATEKFVLDNLTVDDIRDSYYDYRTGGGMIGPMIVKSSYTVAVRRRDFILSDLSGKILSYAELYGNSPDNKTWAEIVYSDKGDKVRVVIPVLQKKENKGDINFCGLHKLKNYSLEERLKK